MKRLSGIVFLLLLASLVVSAQAQEPIRVVSERLDNHFPESLDFSIEVEGQVRITKITLFYQMRGADSETVTPLDFDPATRVQASYRWHTRSSTVPPGVPILYRWEVADEAGHTLATEEKVFFYDDVRFAWRTLAAKEGKLLPLAFLVGSFPRDDERVHLAYAQSYCLVKRLIDEYGGEKFSQYLRLFKEATPRFDDRAAFETVYGLSLVDFVNTWRDSLGADPEPVPTPLPTMVPFPTQPPPGWKPTRTPTRPAQPTPVSTPSPKPTSGADYWALSMCLGEAIYVLLIAVALAVLVGVVAVVRRKSRP